MDWEAIRTMSVLKNYQHVPCESVPTWKKKLKLSFSINWISNSNRNILKERGISDHLTCLLRSLYVGQEVTVRTLYGTTDWFKNGKRLQQGCILSLCLSNLYAKYIVQNARLDESQAGIKTSRRTINNLRYADDTTLMAESKEELKSILMKVKKESQKVGLKLNIQKTNKKTPSTFKKLRSWHPVPSVHGK